jgi:hypothetical protein
LGRVEVFLRKVDFPKADLILIAFGDTGGCRGIPLCLFEENFYGK